MPRRNERRHVGIRELFVRLATTGVLASEMKLEAWEYMLGIPQNVLIRDFFTAEIGIGAWCCRSLKHLVAYVELTLEDDRRRHGLNRAKMRAIKPALDEAWMLVRLGASGDDPWREHGEAEEEQNDRSA